MWSQQSLQRKYLLLALALFPLFILGYLVLAPGRSTIGTIKDCGKVTQDLGDAHWPQYQLGSDEPPSADFVDPNEGRLWAVHPTLKKLFESLTEEQRKEVNEMERDFIRQAMRKFNPTCGTWQETYRKKHLERTKPDYIKKAFFMWKETGSVPANMQYITHYCPKGYDCGGVADHVLGAFSLFAYCLLNNKIFLIDWPETIWTPEKFNWNATEVIKPVLHELAKTREEDPDSYWFTQNFLNWDPNRLDYIINVQGTPRTDKPDEIQHDNILHTKLESLPFIRIMLNRGSLFRHFKHDPTQQRLEEWGLNHRNIYSCFWENLFPLKGAPLIYLTKYRAILNHPDVFSIGVHIRNGDEAFAEGFKPNQDWLSYYQQCVLAVGAKSAAKHQRPMYLVVSDSASIGESFIHTYPNQTLLTATVPTHFSSVADRNRDNLLRIITDEIILSYPSYQLHSYSGFARLAAFVRGNDRRSRFMNEGCSDPTGANLFYTSLDYLSLLWSLG